MGVWEGAEDESRLAWAAGLFEGEGFFSARTAKNRTYLVVGVQMSDQDVLERWRTVVGIENPVRPSKRKKVRHSDRKQMFTVRVDGAQAIEVAGRLRPWLLERRQARLDEILLLVEANPRSLADGSTWRTRRRRYGPTGRSIAVGFYTKLDETKVKTIRERYAAGGVTLRQLSTEYDVSVTTIHDAITGKKWKDLPLVGTTDRNLVAGRPVLDSLQRR